VINGISILESARYILMLLNPALKGIAEAVKDWVRAANQARIDFMQVGQCLFA
tara:strand:+ start:185 stop:343 length:159 start_codon:yes stop_codon:yes gene_type:complete